MADDYKLTEYEEFMRKYTTDEHGNKVIRGLTYEETIWYREFQEKDIKSRMSDDYFSWESVELYHRHQKARFEALGAEHILRTEKPPIN